ncbi:MAG TPA: MFS transporter [bacterium]|nr:MFS transporter [bacterium]
MKDLTSGGHQQAGPASGKNAPTFIMAVLCLLYISDYADRYIVSSMFEFIKRDWEITDAQAGMLMSVVLIFISVFTIPASVIIDRWSRRKMVSIMVMLWSLATLACAFTVNYTQLLVARAFIGIGESGYAPAGSAMLAAAYGEEKRARALGLWNAAIPLGAGLGLFLGGIIASKWGWHHAFGLVSVPGMALAVAAWFLPDYKTVPAGKDAAQKSAPDLRAFAKRAVGIMRIPSLMLTDLGFAMNVAVTTALMTWLPSYFERIGAAEPGKGGTYTVSVFAMVLVGAPLGGFISDRWRKTRKDARLLLPAITSAASAVLLLLVFLNGGSKAQLPLLVIFGILASCYIAPAAAVTQDVVHPGVRAFSYGMCVIIQHLCGDNWSPWLVGALSDRMKGGLGSALLVLPIFALLASAFFYAGAKFYERDLAKVETVELEAE